jgi:drug/metabolite transporter (DMT)-like permease
MLAQREVTLTSPVSHTHTAAGVAVTLASALLYNTGFVLEKGALAELPAVHARRVTHLVRVLLSSPKWIIGFCSLLIGLGLQVIALTLVPISLVQPVFVSGIVVLLALSHLTLGERLRPVEWGGVALVAVALLAISLSLDARADHAGTHSALGGSVAAGAPTVAAGLWLFWIADRSRTRGPRSGARNRQAPLYALSAGLVYGVAGLAVKAVSTQVERYGLVASVPHVIAGPYLYILGATAFCGLLIFQTALQRCPASVIVPFSNVISSAYVVAVGTPLFGEHLPNQGWRLALRVAGYLAVLAGMAVLARAQGLIEESAASSITGTAAVEGQPVA